MEAAVVDAAAAAGKAYSFHWKQLVAADAAGVGEVVVAVVGVEEVVAVAGAKQMKPDHCSSAASLMVG